MPLHTRTAIARTAPCILQWHLDRISHLRQNEQLAGLFPCKLHRAASEVYFLAAHRYRAGVQGLAQLPLALD